MNNLYILLVTIFLLFISAWNLNTFLRLNSCGIWDKKESKSCGLTRDYTRGGLFVGYFSLGFAIFLLVLLLLKFYGMYRK